MAVRLHFASIQAKPLASFRTTTTLSCTQVTVSPVHFVVLHGFLAHSIALHSFVTHLRKGFDAYNDNALARGGCCQLLDYTFTSIDARNHGLSPHTQTHTLNDLVRDLHAFLRDNEGIRSPAPQLMYPREQMSTESPLIASLAANSSRGSGTTVDVRPAQVIAIGHSMGSSTWAQYLMERKLPDFWERVDEGLTPPQAREQVDVAGFVSLDMPPISKSQLPTRLHEDLLGYIQNMKDVRMGNITDMASAHTEFLRCGIHNPRIRGLCTTNIFIDHATRTARWKGNLSVLEQSLLERQLFVEEKHRRECYPVDVPVLSILGGDSPIGSNAEMREEWKRHASDLHQHVIPGATHTVYFDKTKETAALVDEFLTRIGLVSSQR